MDRVVLCSASACPPLLAVSLDLFTVFCLNSPRPPPLSTLPQKQKRDGKPWPGNCLRDRGRQKHGHGEEPHICGHLQRGGTSLGIGVCGARVLRLSVRSTGARDDLLRLVVVVTVVVASSFWRFFFCVGNQMLQGTDGHCNSRRSPVIGKAFSQDPINACEIGM